MATLPFSCRDKMIAALERRWGKTSGDVLHFTHIEGRKWTVSMTRPDQDGRARHVLTAKFSGADNRMTVTATMFALIEAVEIEAESDDADYVRECELQEIADGAWGDGPARRGAARDQLARRKGVAA